MTGWAQDGTEMRRTPRRRRRGDQIRQSGIADFTLLFTCTHWQVGVTAAAVALGAYPGNEILWLCLLYSAGAHGIMTLNDFKAIEGDRAMGIRSLPATLGSARAARLACWVMALPQLGVIMLLASWGQTWAAVAVGAVLAAQLACMARMLTDPRKYAPWYNATGVTLYVSGMMISAFAVRGLVA